jgi:hypothetical protein
MIIFVYTFLIIFVALIVILGLGSYLTGLGQAPEEPKEGTATALMCTTRLLGKGPASREYTDEDFVIEQDLVYTYDSFIL